MIEVETGLWLAGNHGDGSQLKRGRPLFHWRNDIHLSPSVPCPSQTPRRQLRVRQTITSGFCLSGSAFCPAATLVIPCHRRAPRRRQPPEPLPFGLGKKGGNCERMPTASQPDTKSFLSVSFLDPCRIATLQPTAVKPAKRTPEGHRVSQ